MRNKKSPADLLTCIRLVQEAWRVRQSMSDLSGFIELPSWDSIKANPLLSLNKMTEIRNQQANQQAVLESSYQKQTAHAQGQQIAIALVDSGFSGEFDIKIPVAALEGFLHYLQTARSRLALTDWALSIDGFKTDLVFMLSQILHCAKKDVGNCLAIDSIWLSNTGIAIAMRTIDGMGVYEAQEFFAAEIKKGTFSLPQLGVQSLEVTINRDTVFFTGVWSQKILEKISAGINSHPHDLTGHFSGAALALTLSMCALPVQAIFHLDDDQYNGFIQEFQHISWHETRDGIHIVTINTQ